MSKIAISVPVQVPFLPGDGTRTLIDVAYIGEYAKGANGLCAFCNGDPCAEEDNKEDPHTAIGQYFKRNKRAETCPCCNGKPS